MKRWWDNLLCHPIWLIIKWPFGFFILWLVLFLVYNEENTPQWDKKVIRQLQQTSFIISPWIDLKDLLKIPSSKIKNVTP